MRVMEIVVSPTGETTLQTKGYTGGECVQASKFLEEALGVKTREQRTAEYFQTASAEQQLRVGSD